MKDARSETMHSDIIGKLVLDLISTERKVCA